MTIISFDLVGFDLDGTLVDSSGDIAAAVNHALGVAGRPTLSVAEVGTMIGGGAKHMFEQAMAATGGCEPDEFRRLYKLLLTYYAANIAVHTRAFPGAIETLDALAAQGVKLAIVTNKFEAMARDLLAQLGLTDRFGLIIGGDTLGPGKAKPDRAPIDAMVAWTGGGRAVFVGDSDYDVMAARAAGVPVVAVRFGFSHGDLGADAAIDRFDQLIPTLAAL